MKITAAVDSQLGDRVLERGKTYDIKEQEAKHLMRAGLARKSNRDAKVEETLKAAELGSKISAKPGEDSAPSGSPGGNTTVTEAGDASPAKTRKAGK